MGGIIRGAFVGFLLLVTLIVLMAAGMWLTSQSWINLLAGAIIVVCIAAAVMPQQSAWEKSQPKQHIRQVDALPPRHKERLALYSINVRIMIEDDERRDLIEDNERDQL